MFARMAGRKEGSKMDDRRVIGRVERASAAHKGEPGPPCGIGYRRDTLLLLIYCCWKRSEFLCPVTAITCLSHRQMPADALIAREPR